MSGSYFWVDMSSLYWTCIVNPVMIIQLHIFSSLSVLYLDLNCGRVMKNTQVFLKIGKRIDLCNKKIDWSLLLTGGNAHYKLFCNIVEDRGREKHIMSTELYSGLNLIEDVIITLRMLNNLVRSILGNVYLMCIF